MIPPKWRQCTVLLTTLQADISFGPFTCVPYSCVPTPSRSMKSRICHPVRYSAGGCTYTCHEYHTAQGVLCNTNVHPMIMDVQMKP
jgi:hypothetical protein